MAACAMDTPRHWLSALCVCLSIALLFIGVEVRVDIADAVALAFVVAMLALVLGLLCFLREIALATGSIQMRRDKP